MSTPAASEHRSRLLRVRPRLHVGPVEAVWRPRSVVVLTVLVLAAFLVTCLSVTTGEYPISLAEVLRAVAGRAPGGEQFIVTGLRMPRAVGGLLAGAALGLSGALMQTVARNPLASPDILGVTSGSGVAAVVVLTGAGGVFTGRTGGSLAVAAGVGGLLTGLLVYLLARRGGLDTYRLVLIGVAVTGAAQALIEWMLLRVRVEALGEARGWLFGALGDSEWVELRPLLFGLLVLTVAALAVSRAAPVLHLHDDHATGLGVRLGATRGAMLVIAVLLVGVATAVCGPVAFVAFVAPQIARRLVRLPVPPLLASTFTGAVLVVFADWLARLVLPWDLPVGLLTSVVGGPYMVILLVRQSRKVSV